MTTQITWSIDWMKSSTQEINGFAEVVVEAGWRVTGTEDNQAASAYGSASFAEPAAGDPNYVPYAQLTQDDVLGFVWKSGVDKEAAEASIQVQLNALINPAVVQNPLPWVTIAQATTVS